MVESIRSMGFVVEQGKVKPDPLKIDMLLNTPEPQSVADLRAYLGLLQFYREMLPHLAHTAHQLYAATSENYNFQWTPTLAKAFQTTKTMSVKDIPNNNLQGDQSILVYVDAGMQFVLC